MNKTRNILISMGMGVMILFTKLVVPAQVDQRFALAQQQNAKALRTYEWKSRTEIKKDGETKRVQVAQLRYDANGNLQRTELSSTPEPNIPNFGLRRAIAKKKIGDFKETTQELGALARSYSELQPEQMQRFMANASMTPEITAQQKLVRVEGRNVLQPGDTMSVWVDATSRKQRRVEIQTSLDGKPVRIVSEFQDLPQGGPTYMARSQVNYEGNSVVIITENFEYQLAQRK